MNLIVVGTNAFYDEDYFEDQLDEILKSIRKKFKLKRKNLKIIVVSSRGIGGLAMNYAENNNMEFQLFNLSMDGTKPYLDRFKDRAEKMMKEGGFYISFPGIGEDDNLLDVMFQEAGKYPILETFEHPVQPEYK